MLDTSRVYEATPIEFEASSIQFRLADDKVRARRATLWPSVASARTDIEAVFRSWRLQRQLIDGFADFELRFLGAEVVGEVLDADAHPSEPSTHTKDDQGPLVISLRQYPDPPQILATPQLEAAAERLHRASMQLGESLESAAYFALTLAEERAGGRKQASSQFGIDMAILRQIGMLASTTLAPGSLKSGVSTRNSMR